MTKEETLNFLQNRCILEVSSIEYPIINGPSLFLFSAELEFYLHIVDREVGVSDILILEIQGKINLALADRGMRIEDIEKEDGFNQFEIKLIPSDTASDVAWSIDVIKKILINSSCIVEAKCSSDKPGSGIHFHISMYDKNENNILGYVDFKQEIILSEIMLFSIGGMLEYMRDSMIFFAPTDNCYLRYRKNKIGTHIHNPTNISWGMNNRTCAIRIPKTKFDNVSDIRIEHRVSSVMCDSYLSLCCIIDSIRMGIVNKIYPPEPVFGNAFDLQYSNLNPLPRGLNEAKNDFKNGSFFNDFNIYLT